MAKQSFTVPGAELEIGGLKVSIGEMRVSISTESGLEGVPGVQKLPAQRAPWPPKKRKLEPVKK